jgi:hypothetical protein
MSTFIHNEATSLSILQEMQLPQAFLARISSGSFPVSAEVAIVIPHAFGAICLNEAGLNAFVEANPLPPFLDIFKRGETMPELLENDVPHIVGTALDELCRHHPSLKTGILTAVSDLLDVVMEIGKKQKPHAYAWGEGDEVELCELFIGGESEEVADEGVKFTKFLECVAKVFAYMIYISIASRWHVSKYHARKRVFENGCS